MDSIKRMLKKMDNADAFLPQIEKAYRSKWVVYSEASMAGAEHVMKYLGQYTHRVAITNQRILHISKTHVTFMAKDYRDRAVKKPVKLPGVEFLRRFCMHVMPERFVRIRRFGIYNHTYIGNCNIQFLPDSAETARKIEALCETKQERVKRLTGFDACRCTACGKGTMITIREVPRIRSPATDLKAALASKLL